MRVHHILSSKDINEIYMIGAEATLAEAAEILSKRRIGSLIVANTVEAAPLGIISERDIVRVLGVSGASGLEKKVSEVMTSKVQVAEPNETVQSVLETMTAGRFRHMPVMEGGVLIGMISIGDAVKARLEEMAHENKAMMGMLSGM